MVHCKYTASATAAQVLMESPSRELRVRKSKERRSSKCDIINRMQGIRSTHTYAASRASRSIEQKETGRESKYTPHALDNTQLFSLSAKNEVITWLNCDGDD